MMTLTANKKLNKGLVWLLSIALALSMFSVGMSAEAVSIDSESEEIDSMEVYLSEDLAEDTTDTPEEECIVEILSEEREEAGSPETAIQLVDDMDLMVDAAEVSAEPYVLNLHFKCQGDEVSSSKFVDIPISEYSAEEDNVYPFVMPLSWTQQSAPVFTMSVADGVDTDKYYCVLYRGPTKEETTKKLMSTTPLSKLSGGKYKLLSTLPNIAARDTELWLKYIVGIGETFEDAQTYYIRVVRGADINSVTAKSETDQSIAVIQRNTGYYIDWVGESIQFNVCAEYSPTTEILLDETVIPQGEYFTVDLTQFPLDEDGVRTLPLTARYTGTGIGADLTFTIFVDTNHNYIPVISPIETPVSVEKGGSPTLAVEATANRASLTYQWYGSDWTSYDVPLIEGATDSSYSPPTTYAGEYKYYCWVYSNFDGVSIRTTSDIIYVNVLPTYASEASIDDVSGDQLVIQGESRQINVTASPKDQNAVLSYQWYVNTEDSNQGGTPIEGATEAALTLDTNMPQTRYYYCVVTASLELTDGTTGVNSDAVTRPVKVTIATAADLFEGSGTAEDPYLLKSAEDYATLHTFINESDNSMAGVYFKQVADITLPWDWTPMGRTRDGSNDIQSGANLMPFSAILDGGSNEGYTLTIPYNGQPLLGYVLCAEVKNLNIYGEQINGYGLVNNYEGIGLSDPAIVIDNVTIKSGTSILKSGLLGGNITTSGYAATSAGFKATIRNCTIEEGVIIGSAGDQSLIGGFAGRFQGTIENCVNNGTVKGTDYVGGIAGTIDQAMGQFEITNCRFGGSVEATGEYVGGIVGGGYSNVTAPNGVKPVINGCTVTGSVTGADKVGGILGGEYYGLQSWANYTFANNTVTGAVSGGENAEYVGGIVGYFANLNRHDQFYNNFFDPAQCGVTKGFGFVLSVDTDNAAYATEDGTPKGLVNGTYYYNSALNITVADEALRMSEYSAIQQMNHQRSDDPLGADADKLVKGGIPTEAWVTEIQISGAYKAEYLLNEVFDPDGMVITVLYSDGTTKEITSEDEEFQDVEFSGFDSTTLGEKTVTVTYMGISASFSVTVKAPDGETITVKLSILGDTLHDDGEIHTLKGGNLITWLEETEFTVDSNATVWDLLLKAFEANGITFEYRMSLGTEYIYSVTYNGVTLTEKDNNPNSGWQYTLNGKDSSNGVRQQPLVEGDVICFHWTDDYTQEFYGDDDTAVYEVQDMIDALPDPEDVTLSDEEAIEAAREAYENLTDEQKEKVGEEYVEKLEAVEAALEALKAAGKVKVTGVSLTLKGQIGIYIYAQMPEGAATAKLTYPKTKEVKEYKLDKNKSYYIEDTDTYKFLYENVPAKEMTQPLELEVFDENGNALPITHVRLGDYGTKFTCQAVDYCNTIIENPDQPEKLKDLVKAILNYGQCAQLQFEFDTDNLANPEGYMSEEMKTVKADSANDAEIPANAKDDVGWEYGTLSLKGAVNANLYFSKAITAKDETGKAYTVKAKSGGKWSITVENIPAKNLGDKFTVVASYGGKTATIKYSALSYINAVLGNESQPETLKELCKAMILYNQYAKAYFGN